MSICSVRKFANVNAHLGSSHALSYFMMMTMMTIMGGTNENMIFAVQLSKLSTVSGQNLVVESNQISSKLLSKYDKAE